MRTTAALLFAAASVLLAGVAPARPPAKGAKPVWVYGHDLRVRKGGVSESNADTPRVGLEVYRDTVGNALVAVTADGGLAAVRAPAESDAEKKMTWLFAHDLQVRKEAEDKFSNQTPKINVECFKDSGAGKLLFASQAGSVAFADAPAAVTTDKGPVWHHAMVLKVRKPEETGFGPGAKRVGVECFKDGNTGGLVYVTDAGRLAVGPAGEKTPVPDAVKPPVALYGLTVKVRKAGEPITTKPSEPLAVEVFHDPNTNGLIYVTGTGHLAAAPSPADRTAGKGAIPERTLDLKARAGGTTTFDGATKVIIEVYTDANTGHTLYVSDAGAVAVLPSK